MPENSNELVHAIITIMSEYGGKIDLPPLHSEIFNRYEFPDLQDVEASTRDAIEQRPSDSDRYPKHLLKGDPNRDLFYKVNGKDSRDGYWGLRNFTPTSDTV